MKISLMTFKSQLIDVPEWIISLIIEWNRSSHGLDLILISAILSTIQLCASLPNQYPILASSRPCSQFFIRYEWRSICILFVFMGVDMQVQMFQQPYSNLISQCWGWKDLTQHSVGDRIEEERQEWREEYERWEANGCRDIAESGRGWV